MKSYYKIGNFNCKSKIQIVCKSIISICILFAMICLGYALVYTVYKPESENLELRAEVSELVEYYKNQKDGQMIKEQSATSEMSERSEKKIEILTVVDEMQETSETELMKSEEQKRDEGWEIVEKKMEDGEQMQNNGEIVAFEIKEEAYRELINNVVLHPQYPENQNLREILDILVPEITRDCNDTYDKVKACYTYLIENCSYSQTVKYDYEQDAYLLLTELRGSCTYYAAAFHYMMLYIGLDDRIISSYRILGESTSFHRWNEVMIGGELYVFDSQWEDVLSIDGNIQYSRFFMTHQEMQEYYVFE